MEESRNSVGYRWMMKSSSIQIGLTITVIIQKRLVNKVQFKLILIIFLVRCTVWMHQNELDC